MLELSSHLRDALTEAPANGTLALVARLAADLIKTPFAVVGVRDASGNWWNVSSGGEDDWTRREIPLLAQAAANREALVSNAVPADFPLHGARLFAGVGLGLPDHAGALAVADTKIREFTLDQTALLTRLGAIAADALRLLFEGESNGANPGDEFEIGFRIDLNGRFAQMNAAAERVTGYHRDELQGMAITDLMGPGQANGFWDRVAAQLGSGGSNSYEITLRQKKGSLVTLLLKMRLLFHEGRPIGVEGRARDISSPSMQSAARRWAERELHNKTEELALFNDHLRQLHRLSTTDHASMDELFQDYLKTACEILRLPCGLITKAGSGEICATYPSRGEPAGRNFPELSRLVCKGTLDTRQTVASSTDTADGCHIGTPVYTGAELFGCLCFSSPQSEDLRTFTAHDHEIIELLAKGLGRSIYEHRLDWDRKRLTDRLADQVRHDPLTGLPNRICFAELLDRMVEESREHKRGFAVLFIDLDRFKQINDTLGHSTGDQVLEQVAARLAGALDADDFAARMGGDEFTVVLRGCSTKEDVTPVVQRLLQCLRGSYLVDDYELFVTASIGISLFPTDGVDARTLLQRADAAMYRAKGQGKNDCAFYGPDLALRTMNRLDLENQLRRALEKGELQMCFQPLVRLDGALDGLEALLAWQSAKFGKVGAARFIPIAEESGMIVSIGGWVLKEACRQNAKWQAAGLPPLRLSVNVSALQFARADFVDRVADALRESGLPPQCLELELTESIIMRDVEESVRRMWQVRKIGVAMSIDDFGTGYSSLNYLRRLPVDALKIDRSFIAELTSSGSSLPLIQTMVVLAHNMGLLVVAEGVETREQLNLLRAIGCDKVQGHLYGVALPVGATEELIRRKDRRVPIV